MNERMNADMVTNEDFALYAVACGLSIGTNFLNPLIATLKPQSNGPS